MAWPLNRVALPISNSKVAHGQKVGFGFNPLGDDLCRTALRQALHGLHEMMLEPVGCNAVDEMAVNLDEVRLHLRPHAQVGKALSKIVDSDLESIGAISGE